MCSRPEPDSAHASIESSTSLSPPLVQTLAVVRRLVERGARWLARLGSGLGPHLSVCAAAVAAHRAVHCWRRMVLHHKHAFVRPRGCSCEWAILDGTSFGEHAVGHVAIKRPLEGRQCRMPRTEHVRERAWRGHGARASRPAPNGLPGTRCRRELRGSENGFWPFPIQTVISRSLRFKTYVKCRYLSLSELSTGRHTSSLVCNLQTVLQECNSALSALWALGTGGQHRKFATCTYYVGLSTSRRE